MAPRKSTSNTKGRKKADKPARKRVSKKGTPSTILTEQVMELVDFANDAQPRLNDLEKRIKALEAAAASPSLDKGKEWKVGDWFFTWNGSGPYQVKALSRYTDGTISGLDDGTTFTHFAGACRPATEAEIEAYEVSQEKGVLEILDACVCNPKQKADLIDMISGTGIPHVNDTIGPNMRWEDWYGKPSLVETCEPKEFNPHYKLNWLPFPLFKKKLQNTISAKKIEEEQRVVELQEWDACDVSMSGWCEILTVARGGKFTLLDPEPGTFEVRRLVYEQGLIKIGRVGGKGAMRTPAEFLRRAQGTAKKLEAEKERNRVPEIGDRVEFADGGGPGFGHIATNGTDDALNYGIVVDRTGGSFDFILRTRNEFTILTP